MKSYSILESTTGKYITIVGNSDVAIGIKCLRKIFENKAEAENVVGFCNAVLRDSFTLVEEQTVMVAVNVAGVVHYDIEDLHAESDDILTCMDEIVSEMDFGELEDIEWESMANEHSVVARVQGRVLVPVLTPTPMDIDFILESADEFVSDMDFGGLEDIEWSHVYVDDANKKRIYAI